MLTEQVMKVRDKLPPSASKFSAFSTKPSITYTFNVPAIKDQIVPYFFLCMNPAYSNFKILKSVQHRKHRFPIVPAQVCS